MTGTLINSLSLILPTSIRFIDNLLGQLPMVQLESINGKWDLLSDLPRGRQVIKEIIKRNWSAKNRLELIIDRTQLGEINIFILSVIKGKTSWPVSRSILKKKGGSNLWEQKELLTPVLAMLKEYHITVIEDR